MNPGKPSKAGKSSSTDTPADMDYLFGNYLSGSTSVLFEPVSILLVK